MGLAVLELEDADRTRLQLGIDTGTNPWYQLKFGRKAGQRDGFHEIDELVHSTPPARNPKAGWVFDTRTSVRVPTAALRDARYAQLVTYKDERGRSPAYSKVLRLALGGGAAYTDNRLLALSLEAAMTTAYSTPLFQTARSVPCRTAAEEFSLPPVVGSVLAEIVKVAGPIVSQLLGAPGGGAPATGTPSPPASLIADLIRSVLGAVTAPAGVPASTTKSMVGTAIATPMSNRFASPALARQQVFGIDDALLASVIGPMIGPMIQALPQLLNAAADQKLKLRQENNKLITDLMAGLDRRRMMELLAQARAKSPDNPALVALNGLFEDEAAAAKAAPVAVTKSLDLQSARSAPLPPKAISSKAALTVLSGPQQQWFGQPCNVYVKGKRLALRLRLDGGAKAPSKPLARAIAHCCIKDQTERVLHQQDFRLVDVAAGTPVTVAFEPGDLSQLPTNQKLTIGVQLRWPGSRTGTSYQSSTVVDVVLVDASFVRSQTGPVAGDRELVDMQAYRPFWNKVWESPTLQGAENGAGHWNLEAAFRYSVIFAPKQPSNGLMQTKGLTAAADEESPVARTLGRFKAGIELSVAEVNKLLPLWAGEQPLPPEILQAFAADEFARSTSGEVVHSVRLKGSKRQRGLVWVVPVFTLHEFTVGTVESTDEAGQVTKAGERRVRFPVPSSVRVLTMKSES